MDFAKRTREASHAKSTCEAPPRQAAETTFLTTAASNCFNPEITLNAFPWVNGFKTVVLDKDNALATATMQEKDTIEANILSCFNCS